MERAGLYRLLARILAAAPTGEELRLVGDLAGDGTPLGDAIDRLAAAARATEPGDAGEQFFRLFIGLGSGELAPYASVYISGSMHDAPLVALREDMRRMGLKRSADVSEPEDHIAFVMEVMAGLIDGQFPATRAEAARFFRAHVAPWAARFFEDLARVDAAALFAAVGELGRLFVIAERSRLADLASAQAG